MKPALEAARWVFHKSTDFREGAPRAVNLGGDEDTIGAIYGQIASAYCRSDAIPVEWRESRMGEEIDKLTTDLYEPSPESQK